MDKLNNLCNLIDNLKENEKDEVVLTQLKMAQVLLDNEGFGNWLRKKWNEIEEEGIEEFEDIMELYLHPTDWAKKDNHIGGFFI